MKFYLKCIRIKSNKFSTFEFSIICNIPILEVQKTANY